MIGLGLSLSSDPQGPDTKRVKREFICEACVQYDWSVMDQIYQRTSTCTGHQNLPESNLDIFNILEYESQAMRWLEIHGFIHIQLYSHGPGSSVHVVVQLLECILDDESDADDFTTFPKVQSMIEYLFPDLKTRKSLITTDISLFLDSIQPPFVPEYNYVPGLTCQLLPFQRRALTWAINREKGSTQDSILHTHYEQIPFTTISLYYNSFSGRLTRRRFLDCTAEIRGGMLCQTMGLGKTVEQIALILAHQPCREWLSSDRRRTTLVICPPSLIGQWQQEVSRHAPSLRVGVLYSANDLSCLDDPSLDIVLTSYDLVRFQVRHKEANETRRSTRRSRSHSFPIPILQIHWWRVVVDEAQRISSVCLVFIFHIFF